MTLSASHLSSGEFSIKPNIYIRLVLSPGDSVMSFLKEPIGDHPSAMELFDMPLFTASGFAGVPYVPRKLSRAVSKPSQDVFMAYSA